MNIVISGYFGYHNAGDELILASMISEIRARNADGGIVVLSRDPRSTERAHAVRAVNRWNPVSAARAIAQADMLVSGGGGLFQDRTGSPGLYYYLAVIVLAKVLGKKVFVYAAGVNDLKPDNRNAVARVLSWADRITVREEDSRDLLVAWGCTAPIIVTADPVLLNDVPAARQTPAQPCVALVLRPPLRGPGVSALLAAMADGLHRKLGARIVLVPFYPAQDARYTESVGRAMQAPHEIIPWAHHSELFTIIAQADLVVSQRLHALILATLSGIPFIGISDDQKLGRFLREMGQLNISRLHDINNDALLSAILEVWRLRDDYRARAREMLPAFVARARLTTELMFAEGAHGKTAQVHPAFH